MRRVRHGWPLVTLVMGCAAAAGWSLDQPGLTSPKPQRRWGGRILASYSTPRPLAPLLFPDHAGRGSIQKKRDRDRPPSETHSPEDSGLVPTPPSAPEDPHRQSGVRPTYKTFRVEQLVPSPRVVGLSGPIQVRFAVRVTRASPLDWPPSFDLFEVDARGVVIHQAGRLTKHHKKHPIVAVYEGQVSLSPTDEGTRWFRLNPPADDVEHPDQPAEVVITRFPTTALDAASRGTVRDAGSNDWFYANELTVRFLDTATPGRIQEIVAYEGGEVIQWLDPCEPLFRVQIRRGDSFEALQQAAAGFETYQEVRWASPHPLGFD